MNSKLRVEIIGIVKTEGRLPAIKRLRSLGLDFDSAKREVQKIVDAIHFL